MDFKIGDRVRCIKTDILLGSPKKNIIGKKGTILTIDRSLSLPIGVCFDEDIGGHDLDRSNGIKCKNGHGWYLFEDCIEKIEDAIKPKHTSVIDWIT